MDCLKVHPETNKTLLWYELRLKRTIFSIWGFLFLALTCFVLLAIWTGTERTHVHKSSPPSQPLVKMIPNFLALEIFQTLQSTMPKHPLITNNELNAENFKHTRGWVAKFNLEGLEKLRAMPSMREALKYFDAVRVWQSNTFVMNLLIADESPTGSDAVGAHQDDSAAIRHNDDFLAHQVNVVYLQIPENMTGGQVELWRTEADETESDRVVVYPAENVMVEFKGTAYHRVRRFHSPSSRPRISLVVEQYRIPPKYYEHTIEFCLNKECNELEDEEI